MPFAQFEPGFVGKRYGVCSDGKYHLIVSVHENNVADTQCCADVTVEIPEPVGSDAPMCVECTKLQFGKT